MDELDEISRIIIEDPVEEVKTDVRLPEEAKFVKDEKLTNLKLINEKTIKTLDTSA